VNHSLCRLGLRVPDLAASVEHVSSVLGLEAVACAEDGVEELALPGREPCLTLIAADAASLDHIALRTEARNLAEVARRARVHGHRVEETDDALYLRAPNRLAIELRAGPPPAPNRVSRERGPLITGLDHVSLAAEDLHGTVAFFEEVLGFRRSDSVADKRHWLRCGPHHHTVAVFEGADTLHHYAFATADIGEVSKLGNLLAVRGDNFLWGPGRHALGANIFSYHLDPAGAILEVCSDMIEVADEGSWEYRVWPAEGLTSAVMWGPPPPAGFRDAAVPIYAHNGAQG